MITPDTIVGHKFRKRSPYHVGWPEFLFNRLRLAFVHFGPKRLGRVVSSLRTYPGFGEALALLAETALHHELDPGAGNFRPAGFATTTGIASGSTCAGKRHVQRHKGETDGQEEGGEKGGEESRKAIEEEACEEGRETEQPATHRHHRPQVTRAG